MKPTKIAYLAPEIPSVSGTFVFREMGALEANAGVTVLPYTLRSISAAAVASDGRNFLGRTGVVYGSPVQMLQGMLAFALRHPLRTLATAAQALGDAVRVDAGRRWKIVPKLAAALWLARELEVHGAEHLHVHFAHAPATVGMYAARAARIPFSVTAHANDIYVNPELLQEKIERARPFVTISEANRTHLRGRFGAIADRIKIVRCGVDSTLFQPRIERARRDTVFAVGRLVAKKGLDLLVESMALLPSRTRCVIAGDGPERTELERRSEELGLGDRIQFLGAIPTGQIREWMARADVFALPCRRARDGDIDGIPVVLMEAMASGLPVVSVGVSGVPELVLDGRTGLLAREGDSRSLADAIQRLMDHPDEARGLAKEAYAHVTAHFDQRENALRLLELVHRETASHGSSQTESLGSAGVTPQPS